MYYGIVLLLPYLLSEIKVQNVGGDDKLLQLVASCVSDIMGACVASFLIEVRGFGRKNSLIIFFALCSITSLFTYTDNQSRFVFWATASKFFLSMTFIFS
jgi:predicted membrane-bound mannosyltransferase